MAHSGTPAASVESLHCQAAADPDNMDLDWDFSPAKPGAPAGDTQELNVPASLLHLEPCPAQVCRRSLYHKGYV